MLELRVQQVWVSKPMRIPEKIGSRVKIQSADPTARRYLESLGFFVECVTSTHHCIMRRDFNDFDSHGAKLPPPTFPVEIC